MCFSPLFPPIENPFSLQALHPVDAEAGSILLFGYSKICCSYTFSPSTPATFFYLEPSTLYVSVSSSHTDDLGQILNHLQPVYPQPIPPPSSHYTCMFSHISYIKFILPSSRAFCSGPHKSKPNQSMGGRLIT